MTKRYGNSRQLTTCDCGAPTTLKTYRLYPKLCNKCYDLMMSQMEQNRKDNKPLVTEQAAPSPNDKPPVWDLVMLDMEARDAEGRRKYGTPLQPHNGRDALVDAYQEALDLCVYLRQAIFERDGK